MSRGRWRGGGATRPRRVHTPPPGCTPETPPRRMASRYPGRCITCGSQFSAGDDISYSDWSGKCWCASCTAALDRALALIAADGD